MSQKNDDTAAVGIAVGILAAMAIVLFAIGAFLAFGLTILSFFAWNAPLRLTSSIVITPEEARAFVWRGVAGAVLVPLFAVFACLLFGTQINPDAWLYLIVGGYTFGSVGIGMMEAQEKERAAATPQYIPPQEQLRARPEKALPHPAQAKPFRFASWDDEEEHK